jgi:hypothetical protein
VTGTGATMFDWWLLSANIISKIDHPGSNPVGLLVMDNIRQHSGHDVVNKLYMDES